MSPDDRLARRRARRVRLAANLVVATFGVGGLSWSAISAAPRPTATPAPGAVVVPTPAGSFEVAPGRAPGLAVTAPSCGASANRERDDSIATRPLDGRTLAPITVASTGPACQVGGSRAPVSPRPAPAQPPALLDARELVRAVEWLPSAEALPRVLAALEACPDPTARALLVQAERRARQRASPLALASADAPDLAAIAAARAPGALSEQLVLLDDHERSDEVRAAASVALRSAGDPSLSADLERVLREGDAVGRRLAADALAGRPLHTDSLSALERTLDDVDPAVRAASARALAAQRRGSIAIARALVRETDPRALVACVDALGLLESVEHRSLLEPLAANSVATVREAAARALARLSSRERAR